MKPFSQIEYTRPDLEGMLARLDELTARAAAAASGEELLAVCAEYDKLNQQFVTDSSLCYVRYSINTQDYSLIMGLTIFYGAFLIVANLVVDLVYGIIDPRVKLSKKSV